MADAKRVACLYRVSTKSQLNEDDIPMQRDSCHKFVSKMENWEITEEYYEKGVSGYKKKYADRDVLMQVKSDAEKGKFDVLLVYMFDRLGRIHEETPFVVKSFHDIGIEVWSSQEGQQRFDSHVDDLMNFIRYWQSSGESQKTSMRVKSAMKQMAEAGKFTGGSVPYGYMLIQSDELNNDGKPLLKRVIDPDKEPIVKEIYGLVTEKMYGVNKIARHLNVKNIKSPMGSSWSSSTLNQMLKNPIYKGMPAYNRRKATASKGQEMQPKSEWICTESPIEELQIISEKDFDMVQEIRSRRSPENTKTNVVYRGVTSSPLLLVGMISCGHCGSPLTTTYNYKSYAKKDGTKTSRTVPKYRCSGKALNRIECDGQTIYGQKRVEDTVLEEIKSYLSQISNINLDDEVDEYIKNNIEFAVKRMKDVEKKMMKSKNDLEKLNEEIVKSITGESSFKPNTLARLIDEKENYLKKLEQEFKEANQDRINQEVETKDMELLKMNAPKWVDVFESADTEKKKLMLASILDQVIVSRDSIKIHVKLHISEVIGVVQKHLDDSNKHGVVHDNSSLSHYGIEHTPKYLEKYIEIKKAV